MTYEETIEEEIIRGDKWDGISFSIAKAGVDYTGATVKAQLREGPDKALIVEKTITPTIAESELIEFIFDLAAADTGYHHA